MSNDSGPFSSCRPDRHVLNEALPYELAPPEIWMFSTFTDPPDHGRVN